MLAMIEQVSGQSWVQEVTTSLKFDPHLALDGLIIHERLLEVKLINLRQAVGSVRLAENTRISSLVTHNMDSHRIAHKPTATYRIQLVPHVDISSLPRILVYLRTLGISHIYASPIFKPRQGSNHGYDVIDPNDFNPAIGTRDQVVALLREARSLGLGWIQDIVPNHMAFDSQNRMLMDVLEFGKLSPYNEYFDITWSSPVSRQFLPLTIPILHQPLQKELQEGRITIGVTPDYLALTYDTFDLPLAITSYVLLVEAIDDLWHTPSHEARSHLEQVRSLAEELRNLAQGDHASYEPARNVRDRLVATFKVSRHLEAALRRLSQPSGQEFLSRLARAQNFRLEPANVDPLKINYRRFAHINSLIALRCENQNVINQTHRLIGDLIRQNLINGLRIDHIDGLARPTEYLSWLRLCFPQVYMVIEKILADSEVVPCTWQVDGTTGYDFLALLNGIFVRQSNRGRYHAIYREFIGRAYDWNHLAFECRRLAALQQAFEIRRAGAVILEALGDETNARSVTLEDIEQALMDLVAGLPVYRTYVTENSLDEPDRTYLERALANAATYTTSPAFPLIKRILLDALSREVSGESALRIRRCLMRLQQVTPSVAAKGIEDMAFYIHVPLLSLNEVGSDPGRFGCDIEHFHRFNLKRLTSSPLTMNTTSTHDTKRSEDVRARLNVLSEIPDEWGQCIQRWRRINRLEKPDPRSLIDPNDEYHLYQTLVGTLEASGPDATYLERIKAYMVKAVREAGINSSWQHPNRGYEEAITDFVDRIMATTRFLTDLKRFTSKVAFYGYINSLSQVVLKATSPGVPDFYQGCEVWNFRLVDPDNRRPVDFARCIDLLEELDHRIRLDLEGLITDLLTNIDDGRIKMFVTAMCLRLRKAEPRLFDSGDYIPLRPVGPKAQHVVAFARSNSGIWLVVIVPRFVTELTEFRTFPLGRDVWEDTIVRLPREAPDYWLDIFTGKSLNTSKQVEVAEALAQFPVSVLLGRASQWSKEEAAFLYT